LSSTGAFFDTFFDVLSSSWLWLRQCKKYFYVIGCWRKNLSLDSDFSSQTAVALSLAKITGKFVLWGERNI
jgi:hypothetical protein